jgi:hypothetical protein
MEACHVLPLPEPLSLVAEAEGALPSTSRHASRPDVGRHPTGKDLARLSIESRALDQVRQG